MKSTWNPKAGYHCLCWYLAESCAAEGVEHLLPARILPGHGLWPCTGRWIVSQELGLNLIPGQCRSSSKAGPGHDSDQASNDNFGSAFPNHCFLYTYGCPSIVPRNSVRAWLNVGPAVSPIPPPHTDLCMQLPPSFSPFLNWAPAQSSHPSTSLTFQLIGCFQNHLNICLRPISYPSFWPLTVTSMTVHKFMALSITAPILVLLLNNRAAGESHWSEKFLCAVNEHPELLPCKEIFPAVTWHSSFSISSDEHS